MEPYENIGGHEKVVEFFGRWPSFHDAEVLSMRFYHDRIFNEPGLRLVARVRAFVTAPEADEKGLRETAKQCVITLEFDNVENLIFEDFGHRNVLSGLSFEAGKDVNNRPVINVSFEPACGVDCAFQCRAASVTGVDEAPPEE